MSFGGALDDDARNPQYLKTVHRRGFRLLPVVVPAAAARTNGGRADSGGMTLPGRTAELQRLHRMLAAVDDGGGMRTAIITGPAGSGRTALVHHFLSGVSSVAPGRVGWPGKAEPGSAYAAYGPLLEMLAGMCSAASETTTVLRNHAPCWLAELPGVVSQGEQADLRQRFSGVTTQHRHRELVKGLEAITGGGPLILVIEDADLRDAATLDWLARIVRRPPDAAILMILTISSSSGKNPPRPQPRRSRICAVPMPVR